MNRELAQIIVDFLNSLVELDVSAIKSLIEARVKCNEKILNHPAVQVLVKDGKNWVGLLGVLNGLCGSDEDGWGVIAADYTEDFLQLKGFRVLSEEDLKKIKNKSL